MTLLSQLGQKVAEFFGEKTELDDLSQDRAPQSDFLDPDYFCDLLPYRMYDSEKKIYENKSSFGFVIEVLPFIGAGGIQQELSDLIKEIGEEHVSIQCFLFADHRIDPFLNGWSKPRWKQGGIFEKIADKKQAFFKQESQSGDVPPRIFRFFLSYSEPKPLEKNLLFFIENLQKKKKKTLETFSRHNQAFEVEPLKLIELLSGIVNFDLNIYSEARGAWNKNTWLSKQICLPGSAIEVRKDSLLFHGQDKRAHFKTYEAVDFPDQWNLAYMGELIGDFFNSSYRIPSPFYIHYGIHFPNQQRTESKLFAKSKVLDHQAKFPSLERMFPDMPRERAEHVVIRKGLLDGEKFVETRLSCGLWAEKSQHLRSESTLIALFQKYGFKLKENHFVHLPDFLSSLPMAWGEDASYIKGLRKTRSMRTTLTHETGSLIPLVGEWWGNSLHGMPLMGRKGQICTWDPFAGQGNLNTIVVGPSGSGKSVFMQEMMMTQLGQGGRVFILDLGRSFEKLCHLLNGQYLIFSEKSNFNLNPFNLIKTEGDIDAINVALEMISSVVATMAMPSHKIDKERSDIIGGAVKLAWENKGQAASIDDVIVYIERTTFRSELMMGSAESLIEGLKKFGKQGVYAKYFYGTNPIDFTKDLVLIETEELKTMPDLQAVILQVFSLTISNQILMGNREKRSLICIDEAWDLLKSPQMEGFIESLARRLRKYNGALIIGTQGLKDFERSYGAKAAFQNSNWLVMLGSDNESINTLKKEQMIPMDDFKEAAISSLRMVAGKYSELFIYNKGDGFSALCQLRLDGFSSMLYSTTAKDFQAIAELEKLNMKIEEAVEWMVDNKAQFKQLTESGRSVKEAIMILMSPRKRGEHS